MRGFVFIFFLSLLQGVVAQTPAFRSLTMAQGLNDGTIRCFGQDKYGYVWIATASGLNRYNGYSVKQYTSVPGDSTSIYPGHFWGTALGPDGNMYFGSPDGLIRYNYAADNFTRLKTSRPFAAGTMAIIGKNLLVNASSKGLLFHNTTSDSLHFFSDDIKDSAQLALAKKGLGDMAILPDGRVLCTYRDGLLLFDLKLKQVRSIKVPGVSSQFFNNIAVANDGTVWLSLANLPKLVKTDTTFQHFKVYDYLFPARNALSNAISDLLIDKSGRLWVTTISDGLCLYRPESDSFISYTTNPFVSATLQATHLTTIFQDRQGLIWLGTEGYGVNFFQPERKPFQTLMPTVGENASEKWLWARAASEDEEGNLWFATANGVVQYHEKSGAMRRFQNEKKDDRKIYYNSVRGILCEGDWVWFITGGGINRYHRSTGRMDFFTEKDSLPPAFYFTTYKDSRGTLWIGGRDYDGLYFREKGQSFQSIRYHPVLHQLKDYRYGVRTIFEDSKHRMWFGLNSGGLALFDVKAQRLQHWAPKEGDSTSLVGDLITGIAEDKNGLIWVSTTSGIASFNETKNSFVQYTQKNGLPSIRTSCIQVDAANRVWAGGTHGLLMLDADRKAWTVFDEDDGLTGAEFSDMPSQKLKDGRFIFPTLKGFVVFDPLQFRKEKKELPVYVSALKIFNQPASAVMNYEEANSIVLGPDQNFFSIDLVALNYESPANTVYAYKLEGFDKDWIYTKDRTVNYTNVPGGEYRFLYKASAGANDWPLSQKELIVFVGTVYYRTVWFWTVIVILIACSLYVLYQFRMNKQRQILQLETKARELEKEKTVVQYESLKQHLNPHFLFNSLTSLRSLIKTDSKTATVFLDGLSKVYRYVLRSGENEISPLKDEIDFVKTFVSLQKTRFREGLDVRIDIAEEYLNRHIVPVTVQNLVENAIKHNTADEESPLRIIITTEADYVCVQNNLQRYAVVESSNKQGLQSLRNLYRFYTSKPIVVNDDGQFFTVKIPLL